LEMDLQLSLYLLHYEICRNFVISNIPLSPSLVP
jgi:hypothetical protein